MGKIILLLVFIFLTNVNAYKINDELSEEVSSKLNLTSKITVVDFFASWCISCKHELPLVNKLSKELKDVSFIGIDTDENKNEGIAFQKELALSFFVFNDDKQEIVEAFNPIGMPAIYYIKDKKVLKVRFGAIANIDQVIKDDIKSLQ